MLNPSDLVKVYVRKECLRSGEVADRGLRDPEALPHEVISPDSRWFVRYAVVVKGRDDGTFQLFVPGVHIFSRVENCNFYYSEIVPIQSVDSLP